MTPAQATLCAGALISTAIVGTTWLSAEPAPDNSRYQLVATGEGITVRLDRATGDLMQCQDGECLPIVREGKAVPRPANTSDCVHHLPEGAPPPPPGFTLEC